MATETTKKVEKISKEAATKTAKSPVKKTKSSNDGLMAVIKTGGKQEIVRIGDTLKIEKIDEEDIKNGKVIFDEVLMIDDGKTTKVGTPLLKGSQVVAEVIEQVKNKKVVIIRYRAKSRYFKKRGHRQLKTFIRISEIK